LVRFIVSLVRGQGGTFVALVPGRSHALLSSVPHRGRVLVIDDEVAVAPALRALLIHRGYEAEFTTNVSDVPRAIEALVPEAVLLDFAMPGGDGLTVLAELRAHDPTLTVVMLSGHMDIPSTVRALRAGAEDVLLKPADTDHLVAALERGLGHTRLLRSHRSTDAHLADPFGYLDDSPATARVLKTAEQLAVGSMPVMIIGEIGTGKRALAQLLHQRSSRVGKPLVMLPCGGRDPGAVERALMGASAHDDTAPEDRGAMADAAGGTLVLDEPSSLSPTSQAALLAATSTSSTSWPASRVRLVTTSRADLAEDVRRGTMRADLYRQLAAMPLMLPPLRMRGDSAVRQLAERFLTAQRLQAGEGPRRYTLGAEAELYAAPWPGNVRQLRAVVAEAFALALDHDAIDDTHVRAVLARRGLQDDHTPDDHSLKSIERRHIARVLSMTGGQRAEAARMLGITRTTLYKKIDDYHL
jgi:DNA-binding NtrC family response regulator